MDCRNKIFFVASLLALMGVGGLSQAGEEEKDTRPTLDLSIGRGQVEREEAGIKSRFSKMEFAVSSNFLEEVDEDERAEFFPFKIKITIEKESDQTETLTEFEVMAAQLSDEFFKAAVIGLAKQDLGDRLFTETKVILGNISAKYPVWGNKRFVELYVIGGLEVSLSSLKPNSANELMAKAQRDAGEKEVDGQSMNADLHVGVGLQKKVYKDFMFAVEHFGEFLRRKGDLTAGTSSAGRFYLESEKVGVALKLETKDLGCELGVQKSTFNQDVDVIGYNFKIGQAQGSRVDTEKYIKCSARF